jgi:hypothetical protein
MYPAATLLALAPGLRSHRGDMTENRPTRRIARPSNTTYRINRAKGVVVAEAHGLVTITIGEQTLQLSKREALELTVALVKITHP